jgi:hypothetical protein
LDANTAASDPDNGMTAAMAPATGSQTIIQITSSFRNNFMCIADKLSADWFICHGGLPRLE